MSRTVKCAGYWDALALGAILEEQGVQVRRPDEAAPLSMVATGALDTIKAAVAQLRHEYPNCGPIIIEGEDPYDGAPEPPRPLSAGEPSPPPEPSRRLPAPVRSLQVPAGRPRRAPALEPWQRAPAPDPPSAPPVLEPPSAPEPPRQAPAPDRSGGSRTPEPSWGTVLATTVRLWAQRRRGRWWPTQTRWRLTVMAALAAVIFVTGGVTVELAGLGRGEPTPVASMAAHPSARG